MSYKPVDTAIVMVVGPCIDDTDFKSLEEVIAYDAAGMDVSLIVEKTDGTSAVTAIALTTGGISDWTHKDGGYYEIEVTAAQNAEEGTAYLRGVCDGVLPFESPRYNIVKANIYDSWIKGTDNLQVDLTQILGTALTETAGYLAAGFKKLFNVATPLLVASDVMRGTDGANTTVPDAAGVAPTAVEVRQEIDSNSTRLDADISSRAPSGEYDTQMGYIPSNLGDVPVASEGIQLSAQGKLDVNAECDTALANYGANTTVPDAAGIAAGLHSTTDGKIDTNKTELDGLQGTDGKVLISTDAQDLSGTLDVNTKTATATALDLILKDSTFALAIADAIWDEILTGATHNIASSAGRRVREIAAFAIHGGTAQAGSTVTITLDVGASASDGIYNRNLIAIVSGTGLGQTRQIADYIGSTKVALVDREWRVNPDATSEFVITASNVFALVDQGQAQSATATTIKLRPYASSIDNNYLCNQVVIIAGLGRGQSRLVGAYNGTTKVVTICGDNWVTTPDNTSVYVLLPYGTTCTSCIGTDALGLIKSECDDALTDYDPPTRTEATADKDAIITEVNVNETKIDALQTDSTAIKAKTDNLPDGIKKNTAITAFTFLMVDSADHVTGKTGLTVAGNYSGDGSAVSALTNTGAITEISNGLYEIDLIAGELNFDNVTFIFTAAGADARIITIHTNS